MRRFLLLLALTVGCCSAQSIVQSCVDFEYTSTSSCSLTSTVSGHTLIAVSYSGASGDTFSISGCSLTWTSVFTDSTSSAFSWNVWTATAVGGSCAPSVSESPANSWNFLNLIEVTGIGALDVTPVDRHSGYCATGCTTGSLTTSTNGDFVLAVGINPGTTNTYSGFSGGYSIFSQTQASGSQAGYGTNADAYLVQSAAGTTSPTYNLSSATSYADSILIAFRASGGTLHTVTTSDFMMLSGTGQAVGSHFASPTERVSGAESGGGRGSHFVANKDTLSLYDSQTGFGSHTAAPRDVLVIVASTGQIAAHLMVTADTIGGSDSDLGRSGHFIGAYDAVSGSDRTAALKLKVIFVGDTLTIGDGGLGRSIHFGSTMESGSVSEAVAGFSSHFGGGLDATGTAEAARAALLRIRGTADALVLVDSWVGHGGHSSLGGEAIGAMDAVAMIGRHFMSSADASVLAITVQGFGIHAAQRSEGLLGVDSPAGIAAHGMRVADGALAGDNASGLGAHLRMQLETIQALDLRSWKAAHFAITIDRLMLSECANCVNLTHQYLRGFFEAGSLRESWTGSFFPWNPVVKYAGTYSPAATAGAYGLLNALGVYVKKVTAAVFQ